MPLPIENSNKFGEKNYFLAVKTKGDKEYLSVEHKGFFGRIWRKLGFGDASVLKVFNFLGRNQEKFDLSQIDKATRFDESFFYTIAQYIDENPKITSRILKINKLIEKISLSHKTNFLFDEKEYQLPPMEFYKKHIEPLEYTKAFFDQDWKMKYMAKDYCKHNLKEYETIKKECPRIIELNESFVH